MIYHLVPDLEPFSEKNGGAISHTVADLLRLDPARVAVCFGTDDTWPFPPGRVITLKALQAFARLKGRRHYPSWLSGPILRSVYHSLLALVAPGDLVWCHNQTQVCAALQDAVHARGAKLIYHSHDAWAVSRGPSVASSLSPDAWIFVSEALRKEWLKALPDLQNTHVVHNGANESIFYPAPCLHKRREAVPTVLFIGRLHPEKGVHILLEAIAVLNRKGIPVECRIVGSAFSGTSTPNAYIQSLRRSAPGNVAFVGHRSTSEIAKELRSADIFCCPSIWQEPFGKVNVEAMACGIPVVASRVGGIPEIASEGGVLLVEPNSSASLSEALQRLVANPDLRVSLAEQGLQSFRSRFRWSHALNKYSMIASAISEAPHRR